VNRLERLINLVAALLAAERPLSREEIDQRVPGYSHEGTSPTSARRAFERDKEVLRDMGIPLLIEPMDPTNPDSAPGYRIPRDEYYLPDPDLTPDELTALHMAVTSVRLEGIGSVEAIWKLGGREVGPPAGDAVAALPGSEHLPELFRSVAERREVTFAYRGEARRLEPHRLAFRNGRWYVSGRDSDKGEARSFRLDRMSAPLSVGPAAAFERPTTEAGPQPRPWEMGDEDAVDAQLLVEADQAAWITAEFGEDSIIDTRADGAVVLSMRVTNRAAFRTFVLGLLDRAEVLGPPPLRADMVAWLKSLVGPVAS
jgi:predicted DNA-binding transcriptional regulator YafY